MSVLQSRTLSAVVVAIVMAFGRPVWARFGGSGSIQDTVQDTSKAALPGAIVTATNLATEVVTTRQTTEAGVYELSPLAPGEYCVTVSLMSSKRSCATVLTGSALATSMATGLTTSS